ncbi:cell division protein FtsI/penicillin-binding protein 2 [Haloactinospora alba]|uniref:Cell division protein FtsI/penicillin-binding protein 2 n=1 Tax=Haloactinospora alba TaxID=405555 RepID=A0A543NLQ2_9ACTN|nr:penicillin-binding transpeptidase domain-containing protein [Haloactinospora alba]TQN32742.1 cell division protein FtsI/penicillin-binding protein 2 [Haloactinospora alba]
MSPRHFRRWSAAGSSLVLVAVLAGCATNPSPEVAVRTFLLDWQAGAYEAAANRTDGDPEEVAAALERAHAQLDLADLQFGLGPIDAQGDTATAEFDVEADLGIGDPVWNYTGSMTLNEGPDGWRIAWSPEVIHPDLGEGERLAVSYDVPDRGQIRDRNEQPLVAEDEVTAFGVVPAELEDMEDGVSRLADLLDEDARPLLNRVRSAPPEKFQPLILLRDEEVTSSVESDATDIPGVETNELAMRLEPKAAKSVVGEVAGTVEHKVSSRVAGPYQAGDTVGLSGLQNVYQQHLAGSATTAVVTLGEDGERTDTLHSWAGTESNSLDTTLDTNLQEAATGAMATMPGKGQLVAVDVRNGEVLAAAGKPDNVDNTGALTSEYRPGEAFTIVSSAAAIESGAAEPGDQVPCDTSTDVGERTFTNPNGTELWGDPDLTEDFAYTCTTAFAGLGPEVGADALESAAEDFGIGTAWRLPAPAFNGSFTTPDGAGETAATMVGKDGVRVSPLAMALAAGAVADGTWHPPKLSTGDGTGEDEQGAQRDLDEDAVAGVQKMMRSAVTDGQASLADVGADPVHGQVASVEQKVGGEDTAVQWFVGYQGNLAFAVTAEAPPEQQWDQYALTSGAEFLQRMPNGYSSRLSSDPPEAGTPDAGPDDGASAGDGNPPR